jgi:hypothetical protein
MDISCTWQLCKAPIPWIIHDLKWPLFNTHSNHLWLKSLLNNKTQELKKSFLHTVHSNSTVTVLRDMLKTVRLRWYSQEQPITVEQEWCNKAPVSWLQAVMFDSNHLHEATGLFWALWWIMQHKIIKILQAMEQLQFAKKKISYPLSKTDWAKKCVSSIKPDGFLWSKFGCDICTTSQAPLSKRLK